MSSEVQALEKQIFELTQELHRLRRDVEPTEVRNYSFQTQQGETSLLDLFGTQDKLLLIHNMGQACRYCTLWADGLNGFVPHLESVMAVALVSKDEPDLQRRFANSRGWRFKTASHGGGDYIQEQTVMEGSGNMPGAVVYQRKGDKIFRLNSSVFGPGDLYCSIWPLLGMAGLDESSFTPQFNYWLRPKAMEDGGENVLG